MSLYIFLLYYIYHLCFTCIDFYDLSAGGGLFVCCLFKEVYLQIFNVCPFDYTAIAGSGTVGPVNQVNYNSWVAVVTPTDHPKSVRNRCVIGLFCGVVCVVTLPFWHFCWCRGFCHRTESDLFLFLLHTNLELLRRNQLLLFEGVYLRYTNDSFGDLYVKLKHSICTFVLQVILWPYV